MYLQYLNLKAGLSDRISIPKPPMREHSILLAYYAVDPHHTIGITYSLTDSEVRIGLDRTLECLAPVLSRKG